MKRRVALDVSGLPTHAFGPRMTMWWGTMGFITLEGTAFLLGAGAYLYLMVVNDQWPLGTDPPELLWSSLIAVGLLASIWPNILADRDARHEDLPRVQRDLVILSLLGIGLLVCAASRSPPSISAGTPTPTARCSGCCSACTPPTS